MKLLVVGWYDATYSRNAVLLRALTNAGVQYTELNIDRRQRFKSWRLWWAIRKHRDSYDAILVPFSGQEVMLSLSLYATVPIIFDAFTSHYEGYILDRAIASTYSLRALRCWLLDWYACKRAARILTDTQEHAAFFSRAFHVAAQKIHVIYLGTTLMETQQCTPIPRHRVVHFHASNIALQGIPVVFDAIRILRSTPIRFQLIGPFQVPSDIADRVEHRRSASMQELASLMEQATVCLGIFGESPKTARVIPNKVYEAVACHRPVISADTPALREVFDERSILMVPAGDPISLATAIVNATSDEFNGSVRASLAYEQLKARASIAIVGTVLRAVIDDAAL